jgi:hypothetical protein
MSGDGAAYAQPTPRRLYVHDDLTDEVARQAGVGSPAATLARDLLALLARDAERVRILTLAEQVERCDQALTRPRAGARIGAAGSGGRGTHGARAGSRASADRPYLRGRRGRGAYRWSAPAGDLRPS